MGIFELSILQILGLGILAIVAIMIALVLVVTITKLVAWSYYEERFNYEVKLIIAKKAAEKLEIPV